jgi:hypothetical protein
MPVNEKIIFGSFQYLFSLKTYNLETINTAGVRDSQVLKFYVC